MYSIVFEYPNLNDFVRFLPITFGGDYKDYQITREENTIYQLKTNFPIAEASLMSYIKELPQLYSSYLAYQHYKDNPKQVPILKYRLSTVLERKFK